MPDFDNKLTNVLNALPDNWDALWLSGTHRAPLISVNNYLNKTVKTWGAFAYLIRNTIYDKLLAHLELRLKAVDAYYTQLQHEFNCFVAKDRLVLHKKGYSFISEKQVDYRHLR